MTAPDVAVISPYPAAGVRHGGMSGVASYASNLAHALSEAGAAVEVVAPFEVGERPRNELDGSVAVRRAFPRSSSGTVAAMRTAWATGAPVVHLQHEFFLYGGPASSAGLAWGLGGLRAGGRRVVATMHQVVDPAGVDSGFTALHRVRIPAWAARGGLAAMQSALRHSVDRVVVHEPAFADVVKGAEVVPHGVEPLEQAGDRQLAREALGLAADRLHVLCFGFVAPYKGLETVLEAAALARGRVQVIVAGGEHPRLAAAGDRYRERLQERFGHVARFTGRVDEADVAAWFTATDLAAFMYPRPFSSSGALALAVAYGTPTLVSPELARTAALPASVTAPRDPGGLAARFTELSGDPSALHGLRQGTAQIGRSRAWPQIADRHLELYREVADDRRAARG